MAIYEIIGMTATLFILLAFLQKTEKRIRIIDTIGAALFVVYGLLIHSLSVWVLNALLIVIQIYHLRKMKKNCIRSMEQ